MIGKLLAFAAASALTAMPALAAPPASAASLSIAAVAQDAPAAAPTRTSGFPGGGIVAAIILAGVIAVGVLLATQDDEADSN